MVHMDGLHIVSMSYCLSSIRLSPPGMSDGASECHESGTTFPFSLKLHKSFLMLLAYLSCYLSSLVLGLLYPTECLESLLSSVLRVVACLH